MRLRIPLAVFGFLFSPSLAVAQSQLVEWGMDIGGTAPTLPTGISYVEARAGFVHNIALLSDGSVVVWGDCANPPGSCIVPPLPPGVVYSHVDAGEGFLIALRSDGAVVAWGLNNNGQCNVPALPAGVTYSQIAASISHAIALRSDGLVVGWGSNLSGACNTYSPPPGLTVVQLTAGTGVSVALLSNGAIVLWGSTGATGLNGATVPGPNGNTTYESVAAGWEHIAAIRSDGTMATWGRNDNGQCNMPVLPVGVRYTAVAVGLNYTEAITSDGAIVNSTNCPATVCAPTMWSSAYVQIDGGYETCVALFDPRIALLCFGDGPTNGGPDCPCGNNVAVGAARGCVNSTGTGGKLEATGYALLTADAVTLTATDLAPAAFALFIQSGSTSGGGLGQLQFFDGLRCVGPSFLRLTTKQSVAGAAAIGAPTTPISVLGGIASPGTQYYQVVYRNNAGPCNFLANSTNGVAVVWGP